MPTLTVNFSGGYANYQIIYGNIIGGVLVGQQTASSSVKAGLRIILPYTSKVSSVSIVPQRSTAFFDFEFFNSDNLKILDAKSQQGPNWSGSVSNVSFIDVYAIHPTSQNIYSVTINFIPSGMASSTTVQEENACNVSVHSQNQPYGIAPIGLRDGTKKETVTDIQLSTSGSALSFSRGYDQSKLADPNFPRVMGLGWSHNHNLFVDATTTTDVIYVYLEGGGRAHFAKESATLYTAKAGGTSRIAIDTGNTDAWYTLDATDQKYIFNSAGKLRKRLWSNGEEWQYNYYDSSHFANGKLKEVLSGYGAKLQFAYYNQSSLFYHLQLRRVGDQSATNLDTTPTGRYFEYAYTQEHQNGTPKTGGLPLLTSIKDFRQNEWTYEYYGLYSGENDTTQYNWLKKYKTPQVDLDGNGTNDNFLVVKSVNYITSSGAITDLTEDLGLIGTSSTALKSMKYIFLPAQDITQEVIAGRTTTHLFSNGVYFGVTNDLNQSNLQVPNAGYRPFNMQDANGNPPTNLDWTTDGKLLNGVTDAANNVTTFTYDSQDRLATSTDAEGRVTEYTYGNSSVPRRPTLIKVKVASVTLRHQEFVYDTKGRTLSEKLLDPINGTTVLQETTRSFYTSGNGNGMLQTIAQIDIGGTNNSSTTYEYDAVGRVIKTTQTSNFGSCEVSYTVYDAADNVLASICNYVNTGTAPTTAAAAIALFDPSQPTKNRVTAYEYDTLNRRVRTIMVYAENGVTQQRVSVTIYDALSRVIRTIDQYVLQGTSAPGNWVWSTTNERWENGAGTAISHTGGVNVVSDTSYNARGLVRLRRDALGNATLYGYDNADRSVKTVQNAADSTYNNDYDTPTNPSGDPDLSGYIPNMVADQDMVTTQVYDANGNILQTTDVRGISSFTVYDVLNRPIKTVQNAKPEATVQYNVGNVNYVAANDPRSPSYTVSTDPDYDQISTTTYDALGRVIRTQRLLENRQFNLIDWEWDTSLYGYDGLGRQVKTIQNASNPNYNITADPDLSNYTVSTDADVDRVTATEYDSNGRVLNSIDVNNRITRFIYDGLGRQIRTIINYTSNGEAPELWKWTTSLNKWTKADGTTLISFGVNNDENIISETVYDTDGRMEISRNVEGLEQRPGYDAISRQTHSVQNFVNKTPVYEPISTWVWESNVWKDKPSGSTIQRGSAFDQNLISQTTYDEQSRVQQTRDVRGTVTRMVYDSLGRRIRTISNYVAQSTLPETWVWDDVQKRWEGGTGTAIDFGTAKNQNLISETSYDRIGRVSHTRDVAGNLTIYLYDRASRRVRTVSNYIAQGTSDPALWNYRAVNNVSAWRYSATVDTLVSFGTAFDQNHISDTSFNKAGQVLSARDGRGTKTAFEYDASGRRRSNILAVGTYAEVKDYTCYDKAGRVLRMIQGYVPLSASPDILTILIMRTWAFQPTSNGDNNDENLITEIFYDRASQQVKMVNPEGNSSETTYRKDGLMVESLDPLGIKTAYRYDQLNRRYLVVANYVVQGTSDPTTWIFEGGVWKQTTGGTAIVHGTNNDQNIIVKLTYDVVGRIAKMQEPRGNITEYTYDRLGRRLTLKNPLNRVWTTAFSDQANAVQRTVLTYPNGTQKMTRETDPLGRLALIQYDNPATTPTVTYAYNVQGSRTKMTENNGTSNVRITDYEYDAVQRLSAVKTDTNGNGTIDETILYTYDVSSNRTILNMPGNLSVTYEYNARGQLRALTDWSSQRHIFSFDKVGRHIATQRPASLVSRYTYDRAGRLRQLRHTKDNRLMAQFDYEVDARGNRTQATELLRGVNPTTTPKTYLYDNAAITYRGVWVNVAPFKSLSGWEGSLKLSAYASEFTFTYGTGPDHSIFDVYVGGSLWQSYDGYASTTGEKTETVLLNTTGVIGFEIRNRRDKHVFSTGYKLRFKGVVATVDLNLRAVQYTYDALARLLTANDGTTNYSYGYDIAGNLINNNGVTRVYNSANQMTQNGTTSLTYLQNGNLDIEGGVQYAWTSANSLRNIDFPSGAVSYNYDGDGNRIRQTVGGVTSYYVFDVQSGLTQMLSETRNGVTTRHIHSPQGIHATRVGTGTWEYALQDGLGSVRGRVDNNGTVLQSINYSPYGVPDTSITGFAFTGEERDGDGFQYHRARYLNLQTANWLSLDPFEGFQDRPMSLNGYAWVEGNVVNGRDASGRCVENILSNHVAGVYIMFFPPKPPTVEFPAPQPDIMIFFGGSNPENILAIGPEPSVQTPTWYEEFEPQNVFRYLGEKKQQALNAFWRYRNSNLNIAVIGYSAGADSAVMFANQYTKDRQFFGLSGAITDLVILGGTMTGKMLDGSLLEENWSSILLALLQEGTDIFVLNDGDINDTDPDWDTFNNKVNAQMALGSYRYDFSRRPHYAGQGYWRESLFGTATNRATDVKNQVMSWVKNY